MDLLERLNRRFGSWYEGLFGANDTVDAELRPKDILRRILTAMEDGRREGLDGQVYVPNAYTLQIAVMSDAERDYLRAFLSAEELATAVARTITQHGYKTRGSLLFKIEEADAADPNVERVTVTCRFDATVQTPVAAPPAPNNGGARRDTATASDTALSDSPIIGGGDEDDEPGTVPAPFAGGGASPAIATLLIRSGDGRSLEAFPITVRGVVIGRSRQAGNDITLSDPQISKKHARIVWERETFIFYDENSTNGSSINNAAVLGGRGVPLQFGDVIQLGETTLTLRPIGGGSPSPSAQVTAPPKPVVQQARSASLVAPNGTVHRLASEMIVGRSVTSDITVTGPGISERHARLKTTDAGKLTIEDLNALGGTFVNGERIPPLFPVVLYDGDEIVFGQAPPMGVRIG